MIYDFDQSLLTVSCRLWGVQIMRILWITISEWIYSYIVQVSCVLFLSVCCVFVCEGNDNSLILDYFQSHFVWNPFYIFVVVKIQCPLNRLSTQTQWEMWPKICLFFAQVRWSHWWTSSSLMCVYVYKSDDTLTHTHMFTCVIFCLDILLLLLECLRIYGIF